MLEKFINDNYSDVDILFLHNIRINTSNNINTDTFTNGHGLGSHAYFITRHFIESIISKYGRLPKANGQHLDFELNINKFDKNNWLYTEKLFFTNRECIKQKIDEGDNYLNFIDRLIRSDINKQLSMYKNLGLYMKRNGIMDDEKIKKWACFIKALLFL